MVRLGQRLHKIRLQRKQTLDEIAKEIKIKPAFLTAIERGEYNKLPSPAYAQGFVRNYASYLGLSSGEITALFKREFDEKKAYQVLPRSMVKAKEFPIRRVRIQQSIITLALLLIVFLGYLLYQYRGALLPPPITIDQPQEAATVSEETTISGHTDHNATIVINGEAVSVDDSGSFHKDLSLFPGKETIIVVAKNRFGKINKVERTVNVK
jgi:cytoskeletal protein RodZ